VKVHDYVTKQKDDDDELIEVKSRPLDYKTSITISKEE